MELPTSNLDKWRLFMSDCTSPDSFIDFGFYYLIAASLQRRVWSGHELKPLYPNIYVNLIAPPGVGKGGVISAIESILREHKLQLQQPKERSLKDDKKKAEEVEDMLLEGSSVKEIRAIQAGELPLVIPLAANATTYPALTKAMAQAVRRINYMKDGKKIVYSHCSLAFCLEELGSLFRAKTEDVVNFLQQAYDCGDRYEYDTKTQGKDTIRKLCLNFFGGATPNFMEGIFDDAILNEGYSSRTWFIYEQKNRFHKAFPFSYTPEQLECRKQIVERVRLLTTIVGQVEFTPEARAFFTHWWEVEQVNNPNWRANKSVKLDSYYGRKDLHVKKLAKIHHFMDVPFQEDGKCSMSVGVESFKWAINTLAYGEKKMHLALTFGGDNPHFKVGQKICRHLLKFSDKGQSFNELLVEFWEYAKKPDLEEILFALQATGRITAYNVLHEKTEQVLEVRYRVASPLDTSAPDEKRGSTE